MDRFVKTFPAIWDRDLMLCPEHGVAYQLDRSHVINYDADYYGKCLSYEDQQIAREINAGRIAIVDKYLGRSAVVDIGIGSGEFIKKRPNTFGFDVNPVAIEWLKRNDLWAANLDAFGGYTFWDVIEHVEDPGLYLREVQLHARVFISIPLFDDLDHIRQSKHYRPGEHLYYWTAAGFVMWMDMHGFMLLERQTFEMDAGREDIHTFAFQRNRWPR